MSYERLGLLSDVEPVLHRHGYSTGDCAVLFAIANAENTNLTKEIDAGKLDPYCKEGLNGWCRMGAASIAFAKGLTERFVFGALQRLEFDGLIEVCRRTKTRGGIEKRSFSYPDWRRLNLPAFRTLERGLIQTDLELDGFQNGAKRLVTDLNYTSYLTPEDISPLDREETLHLVEDSLSWEKSGVTVVGYRDRHHRDTALVFLRSVLEMEEWYFYPCLDASADGKLGHCIGALHDQLAGIETRTEVGETAPWLVNHIEGHLPVILAGGDDGYHFAIVHHRDQALEYLRRRLDTSNWVCTAEKAVDKTGVMRPSIKVRSLPGEIGSSFGPELTSCAA